MQMEQVYRQKMTVKKKSDENMTSLLFNIFFFYNI
jgi:hypothetical protein